MSDETQVNGDPDPEADAAAEEEDVDTTEVALLDLEAVFAEAEARYGKMVENGRVDADKTYAGFVLGLQSETKEALSSALRAEADRRTRDKTGPYNRRRLAAQVVAGTYDAS